MNVPNAACRSALAAALLAITIPLATPPAFAQGGASATYDTTLFAALKWREIGPYRGGRSVAVAGVTSRPRVFYMGTTGGGVFKTTDGGINWEPITDKYFGGSIGAIGVSESNPDVVYVGSGEADFRGNVSPGSGVYKTTDGGKTWTHVGLEKTESIARVRVDPRNPDVVYVGAFGRVWGPNAERGVFKSTDGGKTWNKILYRNDSTGVSDLILDPTNPDIIYAAFWQAWRQPWKMVSGGAGSGIFKSTDAGAHWTELTHNPGLPKGIIGKIGITVSPVNPQRVWALVEADSGGVYRSDDGGATWTKTNDDHSLRQRAWYYSRIYADPKDANTMYALNTGFYRSTDGGKTFKSIRVPHGDNHDLWIAPNDPNRMIESNDGGANVSYDGGKSWTDEDMATAQFYHVIATNDFPYQVCGAQQDNSTVCIKSRARGGIDVRDWDEVGGGESGYIAARADSPYVVYAGSYGGLITRLNRRTGLERDVNPWPDNPMGHSAEDLKYRFQWTFPIVLSPHNSNILYVGSNVLFKSTNGGLSYTAISPDLTRNDPKTLGPSGGPITKDQTSIEYYGTIFAIAESPVKAGVIWTGSDDGLIHVTLDGGKTWKNVTPKDLPDWARISIIEPGHHAAGTAYVAANRYQLEDFQPYLYKTTDYGKTWTRIDAGIPRDQFTRVIREDPVKAGLLFAGTEQGAWVSFDDGAHWQSLRRNLPIVPVHDLTIKDGDLIAATHGRSFYIMDDISALRQLTPQVAKAPAHLFKPRDVYRVSWGRGFGGGSGSSPTGHPTGANPPSGAVVYYSLAHPAQEVTLEFLDAKGKRIKMYSSKLDSAGLADSVKAADAKRAQRDSLRSAGLSRDSIAKLMRQGGGARGGRRFRSAEPRVPNKAGLNTFAWNLRYPDASSFRGLIFWAGGTQGPLAPPGTYAVRMAVDGKPVATQHFVLKKDPRAPGTNADLQQQFAFLIKIRDRLTQANDAVKTIRNVRYQLTQREEKMHGGDSTTFAAAADVFAKRLGVIEDSIYQTQSKTGEDPLNFPIRINNKIAALAGVVADSHTRPTAQSRAVFKVLSAQLGTQLGLLKSALGEELPKVNALLQRAGLPKIVPSTAEIEPENGEVAEAGGVAAEEQETRQR
ncbi:MAG TPA: glycosyl hydrolase [Gemmatimonadaceae bacterium]|nr:glycosyl hydrolase [Gemmatimonadaceae bacterium]